MKLARHNHQRVFFGFIILSVLGLFFLSNLLLNRNFYYDVFNFIPKGETPIKVKVQPVKVSSANLDSQKKVVAVPVIFYHGVVEDNAVDGTNVTRSDFLSQMVALKKAGYYTIDSAQLYDFYSGKLSLRGKPILISFDDGRVDSYRPTDDILRQLGFKAVFFIVSGKQDNHVDPFFLTWSQLNVADKTGRWDIQSHGWYSHTKIQIDDKGTLGNALTNRRWLADKNRLETYPEASARITNDYVQNIKDLKAHFPNHGIIAYAVPYGDFGQKQNNFVTYPTADQLNYDICKKYYQLCFDIDSQGYNFQDRDPLRTMRVEVQPGWDGQQLIDLLNKNQAIQPKFNVSFINSKNSVPSRIDLHGHEQATAGGLRLTSATPQTGYVNYDLGNQNSYNYSVSVSYDINRATSMFLSAYNYTDAISSQNVQCGMTSDDAYLRVTENGKSTDVAHIVRPSYFVEKTHSMTMSMKNNHIDCSIDGRPVFSQDLQLLAKHGGFGIDAYSPAGADITVKSIELQPLP